MKRKIDLSALITTAVCLFPMLLSAVLYGKLPGQIPIHFTSAGAADQYLPKAAVCFGLPVLFAAINLYIHFYTNTNPKKENAAPALRALGK